VLGAEIGSSSCVQTISSRSPRFTLTRTRPPAGRESAVDRAGELQPRALRDVEREAQPAGRTGGEAAAEDVVQAEAALRGGEDRLAALAGGTGLDEAVGGTEQVHRLGGGRRRGGEGGGECAGRIGLIGQQGKLARPGAPAKRSALARALC